MTTPRPLIPRPGHFLRRCLRTRNFEAPAIGPLRHVLAQYGLDLNSPPIGLQEGNRSTTVLLETSGGRKVLRQYSQKLGVDTMRMEHSVLRKLEACDYPSPRLVMTLSQESLVPRNEHHYALFDFIEGGYHYYHYLFLPSQTRELLQTSGELLGRMHAALTGFVGEGNNPDGFDPQSGQRGRDLTWLLAKLPACLEKTKRHTTHAAVRRMLATADLTQGTLEVLDKELGMADLPRSIIHADYGPYNLLSRANLPPIVLDFEMVRMDWRLVDLLRSWHRFCRDRRGFRTSKMTQFTSGYAQAVRLEPREAASVSRLWRFLALKDAVLEWERWSLGNRAAPPRRLEAELRKYDWIAKNDTRTETLLAPFVRREDQKVPSSIEPVPSSDIPSRDATSAPVIREIELTD